MTSRERSATNAKRTGYVRPLRRGISLTAEVSPCVFLYPPYPLQIAITLHGPEGAYLGKAYAVDRSKTAATYTEADVKRLLDAVRIGNCPRCSAPAFDPTTVETNRVCLCEHCFITMLESEVLSELRREKRERADLDRRMKQNGMTVRVTAWVHPDRGDDYQVDWYFPNAQTPEQVRNRLRRDGSCQLDDYEIAIL